MKHPLLLGTTVNDLSTRVPAPCRLERHQMFFVCLPCLVLLPFLPKQGDAFRNKTLVSFVNLGEAANLRTAFEATSVQPPKQGERERKNVELRQLQVKGLGSDLVHQSFLDGSPVLFVLELHVVCDKHED